MSQGGAFFSVPHAQGTNERVFFYTQATFFLCQVVRQLTKHPLSPSLISGCSQDKFYSQCRQQDRYNSTRHSRKTVVLCAWEISRS